MKRNRMAFDLLLRAQSRLTDAERARDESRFPEAIRYSQECVELTLKSGLRLVGIEYPKSHDVGYVLIRYRERFPQWLSDNIDEMATVSHELFSLRGIAMYGDETTDTPAGDMFTEVDAERAVQQASKAFSLIEHFKEESESG